MHELKFIVTGTPRSGTNFMCRFLTSCGIMCGHESIFTYEGVCEAVGKMKNPNSVHTSDCSQRQVMPDKSFRQDGKWFDPNTQVADSSYMAAPFLDYTILSEVKIIHVVRNPFKTISSIYADANFFSRHERSQTKYVNFVYKYLPLLQQIDDRFEKTIKFYVEWNKMIADTSNGRAYVHRLEDGIGPELFKFLGIEPVKDHYDNNICNKWHIRRREEDFTRVRNHAVLHELLDFCYNYRYDDIIRMYIKKIY